MSKEKNTRNWTVRNVPADILNKIKEAAEKNHRSINGEIIATLERGVEKGD